MSGGGLMTATVRWVDGVRFIAGTGSGHSIAMDGAPEAGGRGQGARPMELVLAALGGCGGFDVVKLLREAGQDVREMKIHLEGERVDETEETPGVFRRVRAVFVVRGRGLDEAVVKQAVEDSATRYSSVSRMLEQAVDITYACRVEEIAP